ncbi:dUTP diphosphatase [Paraglaciecola agarilytica]|jgi:dimeric dUTPase (all-alpha-NTP-PPase superfamily)|uniref:dUTP diphosphatase n=1 Tax=Paraglaciecola chathamensis TaxID=368405 RepID=A0ABS0W9K6_9ALTE|nr:MULTISPECIES: dUTP diphosphatase [Paraglaciecola]AEE22031.1 dUTPase [Glaciecola sp. 4H-3-7+YE-5]MBJ2135459.1 dUTP diphosphatase [Paraglaciecola chathamensis]MBU3016198.1 dUTP diphosphatase [Paraglaciecola agarilytica]|tara:strand:- start:620 stop:1276 length:657 start_codon:yes stop_codon:yes gene_type:complete
MLSTTQLNTMLTLQDGMNRKVNPQWLSANYAYLRAAMIESVEGIEHHGWKWWKAQHKDLPQLQMELVDIWHFALSSIIIQFEGDIEQSSSTIAQQLASNTSSVTFDGKDYDFTRLDILDNLQLMAGLCAANRFDVPLFIKIVEQAEMNADELYRQYVGKNVLNFFRQDNGYKEGSYLKLWNGREDNEHLVDVLNALDIALPDYSDQVYQGLQQRYPSN